MFKKNLQKYGLNTIAYCEDPTSSGDMISLFTNYPKFLVEEVKKQTLMYTIVDTMSTTSRTIQK